MTIKNTYEGPKSAQELMQRNTLVKHYAGSIAYGTALPDSDVDLRGIFCANPVNVRTPFFPVGEATASDEEDTKLYELNHFIKLCVDCNPNIVETLWVDRQDITVTSDAYEVLRQHRQDLLSQKIAYTTSGYAIAQLKRIKGHNKWITNPQPEEPPRQTDFVSLVQNFGSWLNKSFSLEDYNEDYQLVHYGNEIYGMYYSKGYKPFTDDFTLNVSKPDNVHELGTPHFLVKFNKHDYKDAKEKWKNYWEWKNNRNEKRGELEEKFGYDTKHAMHLVRLLRMGYEALTEGQLYVKRPDADELLRIRDGSWSYEELVEYAEHMDNLVRNDLMNKTDLPKKPNTKKAAQLLMQVQDEVWK